MKSNITMLCGGKRKTCSLTSAGSWRMLGPCIAVYGIPTFFLLSMYNVLRDYTVSSCEYGQLVFANMYLSTFSYLKKEKEFKNEITKKKKMRLQKVRKGWV